MNCQSLQMLILAAIVSCGSQLICTDVQAGDLPVAKPGGVGLSAERLARLDAAMQAEVDAGRKAGMVVLITRHGQVAHLKSYGMADIESGLPMRQDSLFRLYSMTKPITSVALLTLYEQGKFRLTDLLEQYLPAFKEVQVYTGETAYGGMVTELPKRKPTIEDVFRHTAGFTYGHGDTPVDLLYKENGIDYDLAISLKDLVADKLPKVPLLYHPGERWVYSISHDVQAYLVEYFSGMPYAEYLQKTILDPLGMTDTCFGVPDRIVDHYTANYGPGDNGGLKRLEGRDGRRPAGETGAYTRFTSIPFGGTGLSSSAMDYARFAQMLVNGGELNGVRILKRETVALMTSNHLPSGIGYLGPPSAPGNGYGLGVSVLQDVAASGTPGSVGQFGWAGAASTYVIMDPRQDLVAILLTQYMPSDSRLRDLWQTLVYQAIQD